MEKMLKKLFRKSYRNKYWVVSACNDFVDVTYYKDKKSLKDQLTRLEHDERQELLMVIKGNLIMEGNRVKVR